METVKSWLEPWKDPIVLFILGLVALTFIEKFGLLPHLVVTIISLGGALVIILLVRRQSFDKPGPYTRIAELEAELARHVEPTGPTSYNILDLAIIDTANNCASRHAVAVIVLRSGVRFEGNLEKPDGPTPTAHLRLEGGGFVTIDKTEIAAVECKHG